MYIYNDAIKSNNENKLNKSKVRTQWSYRKWNLYFLPHLRPTFSRIVIIKIIYLIRHKMGF